MSESREKLKLMQSLKKQGVPAQRYEDQFALGIADIFVGSAPGTWEPFGLPGKGMWLEAKFHARPKLAKTPLLPKAKITGNQIAWLRRFNGRPCPAAVIHFTGDGWMVCPIGVLHVLTELPNGETRHLLRGTSTSRILVSDLWKSYMEVMEYGRDHVKQG